MHFDAGVAAPVVREEIREQILDHLRGRANPEYSGLAGLERASALAERVGFRQQAAAAPEQIFAFRCQLDAPPDAVEQRHTQLAFQRVDLPR